MAVLVSKPSDLLPLLRRGSRLLGLDVGTKTIGIAISDATLLVATPLDTLRRTRLKADLPVLAKLVAARDVGALVIGLPVNMDGSEGPRCESVRAFQANIAPAIDLPMAFWDERLSTAAVTRLMIEADLSRKRRGELVDKMAAAYILQGALDQMRASRAAGPPEAGPAGGP
ncbi:MAG: Holliday junction resolvase RuvX [Thalassobaculales bacterium]